MLFVRALIVGLALQCLEGCTSYSSEPISAQASATAFDGRRLDDPRLRRFVLASTRPQAGAGAPLAWNLTSLTAAALFYHSDIALAEAKLAEAQAAVVTAKQRPNPVVNLTNIVGRGLVAEAIPPAAVPLTIGPAIDFVIETFGKREARTAAAEQLEKSARWDLAAASWQVRSHVRTALLALWGDQRRLTLTRERLALQSQLVDLLEHRQTAGEASALEVSRERVSRAEITLALDGLNKHAAEARVQLATAVGLPAHALDSVNLVIAAFDHPVALRDGASLASWRRQALMRRADIQASLAAYEASQSSLQLAVAGQYPDLTLSPGYSYEYGINQYQLNATTTLPIFNQNQGAIAEAVAKRQVAAANFIALQAQLIGEIDQAAIAYRQSMKSVANANALSADQEHRVTGMEKSFVEGEVDRPALILAKLEAVVTALLSFDAVLQQREVLGRLEDALEHPFYEPDIFLSLPGAALPPSPSSPT